MYDEKYQIQTSNMMNWLKARIGKKKERQKKRSWRKLSMLSRNSDACITQGQCVENSTEFEIRKQSSVSIQTTTCHVLYDIVEEYTGEIGRRPTRLLSGKVGTRERKLSKQKVLHYLLE